ncbi:MAG: RNA-binding cell elongation regulator Jag/EloR [Acidimicrobiia bacterium]|nr:RNA-binding cell elongation regulator Jag/EloR [Acidimicrobiia bacterium]
MEWVEVESKTVDLAVEVAMSELGVTDRADVEVSVVQEPKPGFLGVGGREAIVRVTKAPKKRKRRRGRGGRGGSGGGGKSGNGPAAGNGSGQSDASASSKQKSSSRQNQSKSKKQSQQGASQKGRSPKTNGQSRRQEKQVSSSVNEQQSRESDDRPEPAPIEEQAKVAAGFVDGLLDAFGLEGTVETRIDDDILYIDVQGEQTEALIGPKGSVMQSVLELTRTVVQRKTYGAPRMRIDVAGYGERRREALKIYAGKLAEQVIEEQGEVMLEPMNAADRKVVHDAIAEIDSVRSFSEGEDPRRAVVISYDGDS